MLHITKEFPGIKANDDITCGLRAGEIHALLGETADKSTLMTFSLVARGTIRTGYDPKKEEVQDQQPERCQRWA